MDLADIGVNLTNRAFDPDRDQVIARGFASNVRAMIVLGTSVAGSIDAADLARRWKGRRKERTEQGVRLFASAGVSPDHARHADRDTLDELRRLARRPEVVAIGTCGLDFLRDRSPRKVQERCFSQQVQLAADLRMPLIVHERDAQDRVLAVLKGHPKAASRTVIHGFSGTGDQVRRYLDLGLHIGVTGWICDERRGSTLQRVVRRVPPDRLLVATDAPYLLPGNIWPEPAQGRNEPAMLVHVVRAIARSLELPVEDVARTTAENAWRLFNLPGRPDERPSG